jgi:putative tryptophan/tyrosine transport system substrate-binding protein
MRLSTLGLLVILALAAVAPCVAMAQTVGQVRRIGILSHYAAPSEDDLRQAQFTQGMHELGWREGQTITVESRYADGHVERLPELAADLVRLGVEVIIAHGTPATRVAMHTTTTIPIVMSFTGFAVELGLVASLARPGGNVTGVSVVDTELVGKQLELFKEAVPTLTHLGFLWDTENPIFEIEKRALQATSRALGITVHDLTMSGSTSTWEQLAATITQEPLDALWVPPSPFTSRYRQEIADFAVKQGLPVWGPKWLTERGGLMTYIATENAQGRTVALYVDRILQGAKVAEMPLWRPLHYELVINLKTAKALGLTIPPTLLMLADEVIR